MQTFEDVKRFCENSQEIKPVWDRATALVETIQDRIIAYAEKAREENRKFTDTEAHMIGCLYRRYEIVMYYLRCVLSEFGLEIPDRLRSRHFKM